MLPGWGECSYTEGIHCISVDACSDSKIQREIHIMWSILIMLLCCAVLLIYGYSDVWVFGIDSVDVGWIISGNSSVMQLEWV